ncbi:MAG: hypothetical protein IJM21_09205, partial [Clostridia bacterium]|nr:hypothetical protein [Clostridia bacterium]
MKLDVNETSTSVANNTSTLSWKLYIQTTNGYYFSQIKVGAKVVIGGVTVIDRVYSSSSQYSCGENSSVTIATGTVTVPHNPDGTKTIAAGAITASNTTQTGNVVPNMSLSSGSALVLTTIPRASTITTTAASNLMGTVRTITINRASSSFTHTLTYSFGSASGEITTKTSSTSVSWPVPKSLAAQVASGSVQRTGTITCETFNGNTSVGTSTASFTAVIPPSTVAADSSSVTMGASLGFTITRAASNLTHKLTYKFGSATGTIGTSLTTSASWVTSASLASEVEANNSSGSGSVTLTTYNGSATVGTSTAYFTLKIPASTFTRSTATVTMGGTQTFTITRAASNITHKLTYAFGSLTNQTIGTGIGTSKSWTVPTSLASQLSNASQGTVTVALTTYNGTAVCGSTSTLTFTAKAPASTISFSSASVNLNTAVTISIARASTNMTHDLTYAFGSLSGQSIGTGIGTSKSWTPAYALAAQIPAATSGTCTVTCTTKIGTATVGTATKTLTLKVPNNSTTQPTISSVTLAPSSSLSSPFNTIFIANYTKLRA